MTLHLRKVGISSIITHPSWSTAMILKREARVSKLRKKKPCEAAYPWTITSVGASGLLSKVTVLRNRGSSLDERNHLTFDPGGPEPILTRSWTYPVLPNKNKTAKLVQVWFEIGKMHLEQKHFFIDKPTLTLCFKHSLS
jgi:hypothetical protein